MNREEKYLLKAMKDLSCYADRKFKGGLSSSECMAVQNLYNSLGAYIEQADDFSLMYKFFELGRYYEKAQNPQEEIENGFLAMKKASKDGGEANRLKTASLKLAWQKKAEEIWARNPETTKRSTAILISKQMGGNSETIRKSIAKSKKVGLCKLPTQY